MAASLGKMLMTSVRRLISPLSRSMGLVEWILARCSLGKPIRCRWRQRNSTAWSFRHAALLPLCRLHLNRKLRREHDCCEQSTII